MRHCHPPHAGAWLHRHDLRRPPEARGALRRPDAANRSDDIPEPVDAAFIAVKNEPTIEVVRTLSAKGCGGAVIYAAGFAETGNADLQRQLLAAANGMPLMGPNCYGFVNTLSRAALWPDETGLEPVPRGVALITQSGNIACNFTMMMRGLARRRRVLDRQPGGCRHA